MKRISAVRPSTRSARSSCLRMTPNGLLRKNNQTPAINHPKPGRLRMPPRAGSEDGPGTDSSMKLTSARYLSSVDWCSGPGGVGAEPAQCDGSEDHRPAEYHPECLGVEACVRQRAAGRQT